MTGQAPAIKDARLETAPVTVLLCRDLETDGKGLDTEELRRWLGEAQEGVLAKVSTDLCHAPGELVWAAAGGRRRVVLGVCSREYAEREIHYQARKAGLDPLGIGVANLGGFCAPVRDPREATEKAKLLLAAAIAKSRAYTGSDMENLQPYFPPMSEKVSRRALFTLPPIQYRTVASIDRQRCVADTGCALCVQACPQGALERDGRNIRMDKARCDGCGLCLSACPGQAVRLPGNSLMQLEAQINALLETDGIALHERRVLFVCRQSVRAIEQLGRNGIAASASWLPLEAPCVGMVPVGALLQCVAGGAAVGVLPCGDDCPHAGGDIARGRVDYCRQLLGASPDRVKVVQARDASGAEVDDPASATHHWPPPAARHGPRVSLGSPGATARAARELAEEYGAPSTLFLTHPHSPVGSVIVAPELCTGCGVCATACPTKALAFVHDNEEAALTFDPEWCVACGNCVAICPEAGKGAIHVDRATDLAGLAKGRATLYKDQEKRCVACGAPIATSAMLRRIADMLGSDYAHMSGRLEQYCPACR